MDTSATERTWFKSHIELEGYNSLKTPIWIFDVDRHRMWWANPSGLNFWEAQSLEDLLSRDFSSDSEIVRTRLRQIIENRSGESRVQESWTLYPLGTPLTVVVDMKPVLIDQGRNGLLIEASYPIDLQKDPEALRTLEAARNSPLLVCTFSFEGELLAQNPAAVACYGSAAGSSPEAGSALSQRFQDPKVATTLVEAARHDSSCQVDAGVRTTAGMRTHRVTARRGRDPITGEFVMVLTEEDITDHIRLEKDLGQINEKLEQRVADRTRALSELNRELTRQIAERNEAEEQLRHAQRMEAVGKLTGGVAHDFNNLLTVILGNLELIAEQVKGDRDTTDCAQAALRAVERGAKLTQQLLAFARKQPLSPRTVDVDPVLADLIDLLNRTLDKGIVVELRKAPELWNAYVDEAQLQNALLNLCLNARDAMEPGEGLLTIEVENQAVESRLDAQPEAIDPGDYVVIRFSDNGHGMTQEVLEHAVEPFFTTRDVSKGSGLGLSMVFGFAKQSGGGLQIESLEMEGTQVCLFLPRAMKAESPKSDSPEAAAIGGSTLLVVEDDPDLYELFEAALTKLGYQVVMAQNGTEAMERLRHIGKLDLLLTDVVLPGNMNGKDIAEAVLRRAPDTKILYTSGYPREVIIQNGKLEPGVELLSKPFSRDELAQRIQVILEA